MLDGMIVPHCSDKPSKTSEAHKLYNDVISQYKKLYDMALKNNIILAGIIEDSRSINFCNYVKEEILDNVKHSIKPQLIELLEKTRDTNLLYLILNKGERSKLFRFTGNPNEHPILRDLKDYYSNIHSFYLKTAEWDRPLKIDLLIPGEQNIDSYADNVASIILSISGQHKGYGIPAPIIEADNVAKLTDNEMENFYSHILSLAGNSPSIMKLRREQRPF